VIGKQILNYEIKSLIGEGGMGNVYLGKHTSIGRKVAVKVLKPELASNPEIRSRFKNEASVMAHLQHQGIVALYDYVESDEGLFLVMEYVEGMELTQLLRGLNEPLPIQRAENLMRQVLEAFQYAHKNGIVHRDVKPSNILIGEDDQVKILDFGIAKLVGDAQFNLTKTGVQVGTVYYMSPEQVKAKDLDQRSDIYSLGVTFYELLAGFCPYKSLSSEYEIYDAIVRDPLLPLTDTMGEQYRHVWATIEKATVKDPANRFQNCKEFLDALSNPAILNNAKVETSSIQKETSKASAVVEKPKKNNWILPVIIGVVVIIIGVIFVPDLLGGEEKEEELKAMEKMEDSDYSETEASDSYAADSTYAIDEAEPGEPQDWLSTSYVERYMLNYYREKETDSFNAYDHFADNVSQYITRKNITPGKINELIANNTEFLDNRVFSISNVRHDRVENGISYYTFWIDMQCFRRSKQKTQTCDVLVEIGFNQANSIVSYKELEIRDLKFF
jgi:serine/threonine protein kinase